MSSLDIFAAVSALFILVAWLRSQRHSVKHIRGPGGGEFFVGHDFLLTNQSEVALLEFRWFKEFGNIFRTRGFFRRDILFVADPKALQYVFQTATYRFPKPRDAQAAVEALFGGQGLISSTGETHARQRKVLLPAFSAGQLRTFLGIFHNVGAKLSGKWSDMMGPEGMVINVAEWNARATLEVIGESAFEYKFNSIDGAHQSTELGAALSNLFVDSLLYPARTQIVHNALLRISPGPISRLLTSLPSKQNDRFRRYFDLSVNVVRRIMEERRSGPIAESDKDVLSVLLRANAEQDPSKTLSETELVAQLTLLIIAGHDTTAATMSWMLFELSKNPETQDRLRAEIKEHRLRVGHGTDFTQADYDAMSYLNATIKEALRLHPIINTLVRRAADDDVLPLSEPLQTDKGLVTEIPISKNQDLQISIAAYNRLTNVWGDDAEQWNPERWFTLDWSKTDGVGMTSNLMTFSAGVQGCIGWKFAFMEAQALTVHLIETFDFSIPEDKPKILRMPTGVMMPMIEGHFEKGVQMPLHVKPITETD